MSLSTIDERWSRWALLALNLLVRVAIVYWLAEAWVMQDDPRFAGKAIPERNTVIVGSLSLLFPAIWWFRRLPWSTYPLGLDIVYLSIYALDMAGNSFNLYDTVRYFDLVPHFHSTGAAALLGSVYWARTRHGAGLAPAQRRWLLDATVFGAGLAVILHVVLEAQEYYTDVLAGTHNVDDVADTVNDLTVGLFGAFAYPLLFTRAFLPVAAGRVRVIAGLVGIALYSFVMVWEPHSRLTNVVADYYATPLPAVTLTTEQRDVLISAAIEGRDVRQTAEGEFVLAAHDSVTFDELMEALTGGYHSVEGDVGMVGDVPVMQHDPRDPVGMRFSEWLEVVTVADFEIVKVDVKRDHVGPIIADIRRAIDEHGLKEHRLKLNADVFDGPGAYSDLSFQERVYVRLALKLEPEDLVALAEAFPTAVVSIGAWTGPAEPDARYTEADAAEIFRVAAMVRAAGVGRVTFAACWDLLTDEFVDALHSAGIVIDVWNSLTVLSPEDIVTAEVELRERYGDAIGVVDLRN